MFANKKSIDINVGEYQLLASDTFLVPPSDSSVAIKFTDDQSNDHNEKIIELLINFVHNDDESDIQIKPLEDKEGVRIDLVNWTSSLGRMTTDLVEIAEIERVPDEGAGENQVVEGKLYLMIKVSSTETDQKNNCYAREILYSIYMGP